MPRTWDTDSDDYGPPIAVINTTRSRHGSAVGHRHPRERVYVAGQLLSIPSEAGGHHRSASTGAAPQPQFVNIVVGDRSPDRGHSYERRRGRKSGSVSSDEDLRYRDHHHHRRHSRPRSALLDADMILKLDKLKFLEEQEEARKHQKFLKEELQREKARELYEKEQKEKRDKELQKEYVERWKREEAEKAEKAKREKEEEDRKFEERFKVQFMQAGYSEAQAEAILRKKKRDKEEKKQQNALAIDLSRPTWIKVKRKWLLPETLDHYYLPWEWDKKDSEYIVIKQYVPQDLQDRLFEHTRMLRERKMLLGPIEKDTTTTLKVRDRGKDQLFLVRKKSKSPGRKY